VTSGRYRRAASLALLLGSAALAACGHSPASQFLALRPLPPSASQGASLGAALAGDPIRITAVRFPRQFDRPEVVTEPASAEIAVDSVHRWSAPIGDLARATLTENLIQRAPGLTILPDGAADTPGVRYVVVDILSLRHADGVFAMMATLYVSPADPRAAAWVRTVSFSTPSPSSDAVAEAAALSRLLGDVAAELASDLALKG
jgi:uncharacterized lipoprotein YmbA